MRTIIAALIGTAIAINVEQRGGRNSRGPTQCVDKYEFTTMEEFATAFPGQISVSTASQEGFVCQFLANSTSNLTACDLFAD